MSKIEFFQNFVDVKIDFEHNHDFIYHTKCPEPACIDDYVLKSTRRIIDRIKDHNGRDRISHVLSIAQKSDIIMLTPCTLKLLIIIFIIINENGKLQKRYGSKT